MSVETLRNENTSRKLLCLSEKKLDDICSLLEIGPSEEMRKAEARARERQALKEASKKMTAEWTNTFSGSTKQRLKNAKLREENLEAARVEMDKLEGQYQELRRKYVLDVASKRLYEQTDRIKRLLAAKQYSEALKERDHQREVKEKVKHVFDELDAEYDRNMIDDVERFHEERLARAKEDRRDHKKLANYLTKQSENIRKAQEKEKEESMQRTRFLKDQDDKFREEDLRNFQKNREKKLDLRKTLDGEVEMKKHLANVISELDKGEEKRAEFFNEAKRKLKVMREEKEKEFYKEKEDRKVVVANKLKDEAGRIRKKEEKSYKKAVREKERIARREEEEKAEAKAKAIEDIRIFTENKKKERSGEKFNERTARLRDGLRLRDLYDQLTIKEKREKELREREAKQFEHSLFHQMLMKKEKKAEEIEQEQVEYDKHIRELYEEEETFQKYAAKLIAECESKELETYPLKKAAAAGIECGKGPLFPQRGNIRPKYYASVTDPDELHYIRPSEKPTLSTTKARLGFCD